MKLKLTHKLKKAFLLTVCITWWIADGSSTTNAADLGPYHGDTSILDYAGGIVYTQPAGLGLAYTNELSAESVLKSFSLLYYFVDAAASFSPNGWMNSANHVHFHSMLSIPFDSTKQGIKLMLQNGENEEVIKILHRLPTLGSCMHMNPNISPGLNKIKVHFCRNFWETFVERRSTLLNTTMQNLVPEQFEAFLRNKEYSQAYKLGMNFSDLARLTGIIDSGALTRLSGASLDWRVRALRECKKHIISLATDAKQLGGALDLRKMSEARAIADSFPDAQKIELRAEIDAAYGAAIPKIDNRVPSDQAARLALLRAMAQRAIGN